MTTTLISGYRAVVPPEWVDYNGHMNSGFYAVAFDQATDVFLDSIGIDPMGRERLNVTTFTLESHITYQLELMQGEELKVETQLLDFDEKRVHYFHSMVRTRDQQLSSTNELISLYVDQGTRRSTTFHEEIKKRLHHFKRVHSSREVPKEVGHVIGFSRPKSIT